MEQCSSLIEKQAATISVGSRQPVNLYEPVDYVMAMGGKRIRPALTLLACNLFSDSIQPALMPAMALEVFHNFTLVHDDVMDKADIRRNRPAVHKRWSESTAILSGDAMMILAYRHMCQAEHTLLPGLLDIFNQAALDVCEGQQYDMDFEQRPDVSIDEYTRMITLKTAALLAACAKTGALCGGADRIQAEKLYQFGIALGLTFQIQDDWLDVYSDPNIFGKSTGGDIVAGKKTFLLITALEKADCTTRRQLQDIMQRQMAAEEKIREVKNIYDHLNVGNIARQAMDMYYQQAKNCLQDVQVQDVSRKKELEKFAARLLVRKN
jgi:geranylgeranyl diphosphate synthase type II